MLRASSTIATASAVPYPNNPHAIIDETTANTANPRANLAFTALKPPVARSAPNTATAPPPVASDVNMIHATDRAPSASVSVTIDQAVKAVRATNAAAPPAHRYRLMSTRAIDHPRLFGRSNPSTSVSHQR